MGEQILGCGRYSEHEWAELVTGHGPGGALLEHLPHCPACRAEMAAYSRLTAQVRHVIAEADETLRGAVRDAFVDGVMAEVKRQRPIPAEDRGQPMMRADRSRADSEARARGGRLGRRAAWWATGSPAWAAAALVLFIVLSGGLRTLLPDGRVEQSVGEAWPGGTILTVADAFATPQATGLTTSGVAEATVGADAVGSGVSIMSSPMEPEAGMPPGAPAAAPGGVSSGAPIRVSSGFVSAAAGTPAESEGGFSVQ